MAHAPMKNLIFCAMPTFGSIDNDVVLNLVMQAPPLFRNIVWNFPRDMRVAEARNEVFKHALELDAEYVYFRDYDVITPLNALGLLLARDYPIVGGLYYSKEFPPWPLTFRDGRPVTDWKFGEPVKCDVIGMGATLIKTELFRDMDPPWFATLSVGDDDDPMYRMQCTEDTYFCKRLIEEKGIYPYIDTAVSCTHLDLETRAVYFYDPARGIGVKQDREGTYALEPIRPNYVCDLTKESEVADEKTNGVAPDGGADCAPPCGSCGD